MLASSCNLHMSKLLKLDTHIQATSLQQTVMHLALYYLQLAGFCRRSLPRPAAWFRLALPPPTTCHRLARYKMCMWLLAIVPFVAECMWLSAIMPFYLLRVLETSPCRGGAAEI